MREELLSAIEPPAGGARRHPGRHEVVEAVLVRDGERIAAIVKKVPIDLRQRLLGSTRGARSFRTAEALLARGIETPEPLAAGTVGEESWFVARLVPGAVQVRAWFRPRYEPGQPPPPSFATFEQVAGELGRLARRMHDAGVRFRDFTDGNVLVTDEGGRPRLWLVDLDRARVGSRPVGWWGRMRDLSRPGLNTPGDRRVLLASYFGSERGAGAAELAVTLLRGRIRLWDALKRRLRPWRS